MQSTKFASRVSTTLDKNIDKAAIKAGMSIPKRILKKPAAAKVTGTLYKIEAAKIKILKYLVTFPNLYNPPMFSTSLSIITKLEKDKFCGLLKLIVQLKVASWKAFMSLIPSPT